MQPIQLFHEIFFNRVGWCAAFCGADIMRTDWKPTGLVCFWVSFNASFLVVSAYTFMVCDADTMWKLLTIFGIGVQVGIEQLVTNKCTIRFG